MAQGVLTDDPEGAILAAAIDAISAEAELAVAKAFARYANALSESMSTEIAGHVAGSVWNEISERLLRDVSNELAGVVATIATKTLRRFDPEAQFKMDNPFTIQWLKSHGFDLVQRIDRGTRDGMRESLAEAIVRGDTTRELGVYLRRIIGLDARGAMAVARLKASGAPAAEVASYAKDKLAQRALTIARTEVMSAGNHGAQAAWGEAAARGLLLPQTRKVWIATPSERTCPMCMAMHGMAVDVDAPFPFDGGLIMTPPLHPACRCSMGLRTEVARAPKPISKAAVFLSKRKAFEKRAYLGGRR